MWHLLNTRLVLVVFCPTAACLQALEEKLQRLRRPGCAQQAQRAKRSLFPMQLNLEAQEVVVRFEHHPMEVGVSQHITHTKWCSFILFFMQRMNRAGNVSVKAAFCDWRSPTTLILERLPSHRVLSTQAPTCCVPYPPPPPPYPHKPTHHHQPPPWLQSWLALHGPLLQKVAVQCQLWSDIATTVGPSDTTAPVSIPVYPPHTSPPTHPPTLPPCLLATPALPHTLAASLVITACCACTATGSHQRCAESCLWRHAHAPLLPYVQNRLIILQSSPTAPAPTPTHPPHSPTPPAHPPSPPPSHQPSPPSHPSHPPAPLPTHPVCRSCTPPWWTPIPPAHLPPTLPPRLLRLHAAMVDSHPACTAPTPSAAAARRHGGLRLLRGRRGRAALLGGRDGRPDPDVPHPGAAGGQTGRSPRVGWGPWGVGAGK